MIAITFILFYSEPAVPSTSEQPAKKRKFLPKILDGTFFIVTSQDGDTVEAKCIECNETKKGNTKSTGNFIVHYKKVHAARFKEMEAYLKATKTEQAGKIVRQCSIEKSFVRASSNNVCGKLIFLV